MLSDTNVRAINAMISKELRALNSFLVEDDDKLAILQRIAELKALLDDPSKKTEEPKPANSDTILSEILNALRR